MESDAYKSHLTLFNNSSSTCPGHILLGSCTLHFYNKVSHSFQMNPNSSKCLSSKFVSYYQVSSLFNVLYNEWFYKSAVLVSLGLLKGAI